jgi:hypothetical protein
MTIAARCGSATPEAATTALAVTEFCADLQQQREFAAQKTFVKPHCHLVTILLLFVYLATH